MASRNLIKIKNLTITAWNARSIKQDMVEVREAIEQFSVDVLLVNGTWLRPHDTIRVANCDVIRKD